MLDDCPIVIATYNRAAVLYTTLERLYDLPERPPVLVVDNGSCDGTQDVCKRFGTRVRSLKLQKNVGAAARTVGARLIASPYVAFCDDDCAWSAGSLKRAVERFEAHSDVAVLNGRVLVGDGEIFDPACAAMRRTGTAECTAGIRIAYFMAGASIMRRVPFLEAGGYHVRYFMGAEESLLSLDLAVRGWKLWYCDDLILRHHPSAINRDPESRRRLVLRNRLWTTMLRRSPSCAFAMLAQYARLSGSDRIVRRALREAIAGLPWVLRERRRIPAELERFVRQLDAALA